MKRKSARKRSVKTVLLPYLKVGDYYIGARASGGYWIEHESGEGMQTGKALEEAIREFYRKHF